MQRSLQTLLLEETIKNAVGNELIIKRDAKSKILHVQLNRPNQLNALSLKQVKYLSELLPAIDDSNPIDECSAVVLTGVGDKAFCAGRSVCILHSL